MFWGNFPEGFLEKLDFYGFSKVFVGFLGVFVGFHSGFFKAIFF